MRTGLLLALLLLTSLSAGAVEPNERLADPVLENRARAISAELRCLVCQNESIDESHADLAHDIRMLVRERLSAGDSDVAATQAVVARYGDFVLLRPPVLPATWVLWFGPPVLLVVALGGSALWLRKRAAVPAAMGAPTGPDAGTPLSEREHERLAQLLGKQDLS